MNLNQNYQNEVYIQRKEKRRIYKSGLLKQRIEKKIYTQLQAVQVVNSFSSKIFKCKELKDWDKLREAKKG